MKTFTLKGKILLVLVAPLFMYNVCGKHDPIELPDFPNTDEYFTWRIPGYNGNLTAPPDSILYSRTSNTNIFVAYNSSGSVNSYVSFDGAQTAGTYSSSNFIIYTSGKYYVPGSSPIQINVSVFGTAGQPITGSYAGTVRDSTTSATQTVTGNFKVKNQ